MFLVIPSYPNYSACTTANQDFKDTLVGGACHQTGVEIPKSPCNNGHNYCVSHRNTRRNTQKQGSVFVIMSKMVRKLFKHLSFATKKLQSHGTAELIEPLQFFHHHAISNVELA